MASSESDPESSGPGRPVPSKDAHNGQASVGEGWGRRAVQCRCWQVVEVTFTGIALSSWSCVCIMDLSGLWWPESNPAEDSGLSRSLSLAVLLVALVAVVSRCCGGAHRNHSRAAEAWSPPGHSTTALLSDERRCCGPCIGGASRRHLLAAIATQWFLLCGATAWLALHAANRRGPQVVAGAIAVSVLLPLFVSTAVMAFFIQQRPRKVGNDAVLDSADMMKLAKELESGTTPDCATQPGVERKVSIAGEAEPSVKKGRWQPLFMRTAVDDLIIERVNSQASLKTGSSRKESKDGESRYIFDSENRKQAKPEPEKIRVLSKNSSKSVKSRTSQVSSSSFGSFGSSSKASASCDRRQSSVSVGSAMSDVSERSASGSDRKPGKTEAERVQVQSKSLRDRISQVSGSSFSGDGGHSRRPSVASAMSDISENSRSPGTDADS
eukprot:TRINITY_DN27464_c0_g1_i1.p1 TRINITY_DN27464_c0_g1~~TRINITY_DN27464_c0_g1_i1.p1  ORF type:complete len:439 (+),score=70.21 TRINITY_DN27464_c0_g1_i1:67-1383(+)